jgi:phosphoglycolate phosphatase
LKKNQTLIVYDLDGTLVDSAKTVVTVLNSLRTELGLDPLSTEKVLSSISLGGEDLIRQALCVTGANVHHYLQKFRSLYLEIPTPQNCVYAGATETLSELYFRDIKLAICTNKPRNLTNKVLNETGLGDYFSFVNAGGDLITKKPSSENLQACIDFFDVEFDKIFLVGDSTVDQNLAINSGVEFFFYASGYDDGVDIKSAKAVIRNHSELLEFI